MLTDDEVKTMEATAAKLFGGDGDAAFGDSIYVATLRNVLGSQKGFKSPRCHDQRNSSNSFWVVGRWFENRTSLISNPSNGEDPCVDRRGEEAPGGRGRTPASSTSLRRPGGHRPRRALHHRQRAHARGGVQQLLPDRADALVGRESAWRCAHDTRMISDRQPYRTWRRACSSGWVIRSAAGKAIRWWSIRPTSGPDSPVAGRRGASENLHLVERFTRAAPETLKVRSTPSTIRRHERSRWTAVLFHGRSDRSPSSSMPATRGTNR